MSRVSAWLPTGRSGAWEVRRRAGSSDVTELIEHVQCGELLWMDDADSELRAHKEILAAAHGDVLLLGLGIGFLPAMLVDVDAVHSITIIERSNDVMRLVEPHFMGQFGSRKGLRIFTADAEEWQTSGERYDVAWLDHVLAPLKYDQLSRWIDRASQWANQVLAWGG